MHRKDDWITELEIKEKISNSDIYYIENGYKVFTEQYLKSRGYCCGSGCRHCPYEPKHTKTKRK
jgi:hypothetical protein